MSFWRQNTWCAGRVSSTGCDLGFFSQRLMERGRHRDRLRSEGLVDATRRRAGCEALVADALDLAHLW